MDNRIIVMVFPSRNILSRALDHLLELDKLNIERAAIVARARSGEIIILDDDVSPDEGGIAGGTLGAAMTALGLVQLGALALPGVGPIIALGAGALVGGLVGRITGRFAANLIDFGFKNRSKNWRARSKPAIPLWCCRWSHPALPWRCWKKSCKATRSSSSSRCWMAVGRRHLSEQAC